MRHDTSKVGDSWRLILLQAAEEVRKRGHTKDTQLAEDGSVCVHGAINIARGEFPPGCHRQTNREAESRLAKYLLEVHGVEPYMHAEYGSAHWNNAPERTADEVISALEGAAFHDKD